MARSMERGCDSAKMTPFRDENAKSFRVHTFFNASEQCSSMCEKI
jgi:hypothetical protein